MPAKVRRARSDRALAQHVATVPLLPSAGEQPMDDDEDDEVAYLKEYQADQQQKQAGQRQSLLCGCVAT